MKPEKNTTPHNPTPHAVAMTRQERLDRINEIKIQIARSITYSRYFKVNKCIYDAPTRAISARVKKLLKELDRLEKQEDSPYQGNVVGYIDEL